MSSPKRSIAALPLKKMRTEGDGVGLVPQSHATVDIGGGFEVRNKVDPTEFPYLPGLKLDQGGPMLLLEAFLVLYNAWALCGAVLAEHPTDKSEGGSPKNVRNIHLLQAQRCHEFLFEEALEFGPGEKDVVS